MTPVPRKTRKNPERSTSTETPSAFLTGYDEGIRKTPVPENGSGRPRDTRRLLLEAAERAIRTRGLMGASTREIAREAGVADGTLYVHFADRIDLFIALIQEHLPPYTEPLRRLNSLVGRRTVRANLSEVFEGALTWYEELLPLSGAISADRELFDALHKRLMERGEGPHLAIKTLENYLKAEQALGRVNSRCDTRASAMLLFGAASYWVSISPWVCDQIQYSREQLTKDVLKSFMAGLDPSSDKTRTKRKTT